MRAHSPSTSLVHRVFTSVVALAAAVFLLGLFSSTGASAQSSHGQDKVTIIVKMAPGSESAQADTIKRNGGTEKSRVDKLKLRIIEVPAQAADAILKKYQDDPNVTRAEKSKQRQTDRAPVDPLFGSQWALGKIGWTDVFGTMTPTGTATVAVLDTGINAAHPDLAGNVVAGTSVLDGSSGMTDPNGHGTWVAGIVAARSDNGEGIAGVGFAGVRVMPVTVLDQDGLGQDADVVQGVVWATDNGASVILMAFSNPGFSEALQDAIDYAWSHGVVIVAAAGNDGWSTPSFPAGDRGVIGVAATDENDVPAEFSNEGQSVFMAAPGTNIQTTDEVGYTSVTGTSSSAAFVAGAAALLKAFDPTASNGVIVGRLARNADLAGSTGETGNGRLNLARALSDTGTEAIQPAGADPVGSGGPFVGPYVTTNVNTSIALASSAPANTSIYGTNVTFTATVSCAAIQAGTPCTSIGLALSVGTVTIMAGGNSSCTGGISIGSGPVSAGTFSASTATLGSPSQLIRACYSGSGSPPNRVNPNDTSLTQTVNKQNSTTSIESHLPDPSALAQSYSVVVKVLKAAGAGADPTGNVTVVDGSGATCTTPALVSNQASCALASTSAGSKGLVATYNGDSNYNTSSGTATHQVNKSNTATTITNAAALLSTPTVIGQAYTINFTVTPSQTGGVALTGTVSVNDGTDSCSANLPATSCTITPTTAGAKSPTATYGGDSSYNTSASAAASHTVNLRATTTSVSCSLSSVPVGVSTTCTATVTDTSAGSASTPGGINTVTFSASGASVSPTGPTCSVTGSGSVATCTAVFTGSSVGTIAVSASYGGDTSHNGSNTASPFNVTVTARTTQTTVSCASPVLPNQASSCTVTVKDTDTVPQTTPGGSVTVTASGAGASPASQSCTPLSGSGNTSTCTVSISGTSGGTINVSASYPATVNHAASSGTATITVNSRTTSTMVSCTTPISEGTTSICTATVSDTSTGTPTTPIGTVNFANTGPVTSPTATCTLSGGTCSVLLTSNNPGTINVTASYVGNTFHSPSSGTASINVQRSSSTGVACPASTFTNVATGCTITVSDTSMGAVTPTGTVNVTASGAGVSPTSTSCTLGGTGNNATCNVSFTGTVGGTITVTATYPGSLVHFGSNGGDSTTVIKQFTITATAGANGTIAPSGAVLVSQGTNQTFTITPNGGFVMNDVVVDGSSVGAVTSYPFNNVQADHTIAATFKSANVAPVSASQTVTSNEDTFVVITLSATDADGNALTFSLGGVSNGSLTDATLPSCSGTPSTCAMTIKYTPNSNFNGSDSFTFTTSDGSLTSNTAAVGINITAVNDAPVAVDDTYSTNEDTPLNVVSGVLANDSDPEGTTLTAVLVAGPTNASSFTLNPNGSFSYTPTSNYNGSDTFTYKAYDGELYSNVATVTITVYAVNDAPVAGNDFYNTDEDTQLDVAAPGVLANDNDVDSPVLAVVLATGPSHAQSFTLNPDGSFSYKPVANYNGPDSFTYKATDGTLDSNVATVTIAVNPIDDAPIGVNDSYTTDEDTTLTVNAVTGVLANDSDIDNASLTAVLVDSPLHGDLTLNPDGSFEYVPDSNYSGNDSFTYRASDGILTSAIVQVNITINPVNDPPVAMAGSATTDEDVGVAITLTATDVDSSNLTFNVGSPSHGTLTPPGGAPSCSLGPSGYTCTAVYTYSPTADYNGPDSFSFTASDGSLTSNAATVSITVKTVNDPPKFDAIGDQTVDEDSGSHNVSITGVSPGPADESGQTVSFAAVSSDPSIVPNPTVSGSGATRTLTFASAPNAFGEVIITVTADDGQSANNTSQRTFKITVNSVNDPPTFDVIANQTVDEDTGPHTISITGVSAGPANESGQTVTLTATSSNTAIVLNPTITGTGSTRSLQYTLVPDANGEITITVTADDGQSQFNTATRTFKITVNAVNDPPFFNAIPDQTVLEDSGAGSVSITGVSAGPPDEASQTVTFTAVSSNTALMPNPIVTGSGPTRNLLFTPTANANGQTTITVTANDGQSVNATFTRTFKITVTNVNDPPVATNGSPSTQEDTSVDIILVGGDIDSPTLTFNIGAPNAGTLSSQTFLGCDVVANATGIAGSSCKTKVTYTPPLNYNTTDDPQVSFTFTVSDGQYTSPSATVSITIASVNDPPANLTITQSAATINENDSLTVSGTFTDPDKSGNTLSVLINWGDGSPVSPATITGSATTGYSYTATHQYLDDKAAPAADVFAISVTVSDGVAAPISTSGSVTVNNVPPVAGTVTGPAGPIQKGSTAPIVVQFTDVGSLDTHTCTFSWDDSTPNTIVTANPTTRTCTASHQYPDTGVYTVGITITDDDGGSTTTSFKYVVVYDPSGGFVTGGGWINSPAGAYKANLALVGKANFGFVSKYQKGSNVPVGDTEFQFQAGDFKFNSTSYDWLVVSGAKAQYKGVGTVNGVPGYSFLLTAYDGDGGTGNNASGGPDKFRIKVMGNGGGTVYDNNVNGAGDDIDTADPQAIGGGSIVVHK